MDRFDYKVILVDEILLPQNASNMFVSVKTFPKGFKY